jgi:uncharacterized protein (DUF302 family)
MTPPSLALGFSTQLNTDFASAIQRVTDALKTEGFGVLTEIDVQATFKKKLNVDFRPYKILGACHPSLAHKALSTTPEVGLLLPCNVTITQTGPGQVEVSIVDPLTMLGVVGQPELEPVASEARVKLARVINSLHPN